MSNNIVLIERTRCWNRNGCLFPSTAKVVFRAVLPFMKNIIVRQLLDILKTRPPEIEEGYEDLYLAACDAPRSIRFYNHNREELISAQDQGLDHFVVEYGEDNGIDSPVLVEAYSFREIQTSWRFAADEEFHHDFIRFVQAGVLTDGEHFLYWNVTEDQAGRQTCHIHNSILMDSDTEEVWYPWTPENDAKVLDALNNPATGDDWSGEMSVLLGIEFDDFE
jgi:hypothetical protein